MEIKGINIVHSTRARRISLAVKQSGEVRLTIPSGVSEAEAMTFAQSKREWIEISRARMAERFPLQIISMPHSTHSHSLRLSPCATNKIRVRVADKQIIVNYPIEVSFESNDVQQAIRKGVEQAWRIEAQEYLPPRIEIISRDLGFKYGGVSVRNTRSRWGSCSGKDEISLSLHLMKLPTELIDYIIIHELCHTKHKNHGPKFHALLNKCTDGKHLSLRKQLKMYSTRW